MCLEKSSITGFVYSWILFTVVLKCCVVAWTDARTLAEAMLDAIKNQL